MKEMKEVFIKQAEVINQAEVQITDLLIKNGQLNFARVANQEHYQPQQIIDARNCYVTAGLFDLQINGSPQCNLWGNPTASQFSQLCQLLLAAGVTAFLPTLITDDWQHLIKNIKFLESMGVGREISYSPKEEISKFNPTELMVLPGIHLEGPFLSPQKPGVHPKQYLKPLLMADLKELIRPSVKLMTLAPELENGKNAIEYLRKNNIIASLGHSNATFNEAVEAFNGGITMVTHTFNALPPIHHRRPGANIAALLAKDVYCCIIGDGLHVDPNMVKLLIEMKGIDRVILVTDMASIGTTGGELVGASITLPEAIRNIVNWGIATFPEAIQMATANPAKAMNLDHSLGHVENGRRADLVIWDKQTLAIKHVIANGVLVFSAA